MLKVRSGAKGEILIPTKSSPLFSQYQTFGEANASADAEPPGDFQDTVTLAHLLDGRLNRSPAEFRAVLTCPRQPADGMPPKNRSMILLSILRLESFPGQTSSANRKYALLTGARWFQNQSIFEPGGRRA
jgi:hypothetical protein